MRRLLPLLAFVLLLFPLAHSARAQEPALDIDKTFTAANALLEKKQYADALTEYRKILAVKPDDDDSLHNGAMAAFFAGDYKTSLAYYQKLKARDANDGFIRTRLIQVYQAMGDDKARDAERADFIALHNAGKDTSSFTKRPEYCRDQYRLGPRLILVYEPFVFAPRTKDGMFAPRYRFVVVGDDDKAEVQIEAGWDAAKKNAKGIYEPDKTFGAFYFDAYYPTGPYARRTMGLFTEEPSYRAAKAHVQAILEGKVVASGGTLRAPTKPAAPPTKP